MKTFLSIVILMTLWSGASAQDWELESDGSVLLPIEEDIPHFYRDHIPVSSETDFSELQDAPPLLNLLWRYLNNPDSVPLKTLNVFLDRPERVVSAANGNLVILDSRNFRLLEYNLDSDTSQFIAERGEGPGDVNFPRDLISAGSNVYLTSQSYYLSWFNCEATPCEYSETLSLDVQPESISVIDDQITILANPNRNVRSGWTLIEELMGDVKPVYTYDHDGNELANFGDLYRVHGHRILTTSFLYNSKIHYSSATDAYVVVNPRLPIIYLYDADGKALSKTYEVTDYILGKQPYWPADRRLQVVLEDNTYYAGSGISDGRYLWIEVMTQTNLVIDYETRTQTSDIGVQHYVIDLATDGSYLMHEMQTDLDGYREQFYLTDLGLVIYNREDGNLYFAGLE